MGEAQGTTRSWDDGIYRYPKGARRATPDDVSRELARELQQHGITDARRHEQINPADMAERRQQARNRANAARGAQYGITQEMAWPFNIFQNTYYRDPNATIQFDNQDKSLEQIVSPDGQPVRSSVTMVGNRAVDNDQLTQPARPTPAPMRQAFEQGAASLGQGAASLGQGLAAAGEAVAGAADTARIRLAKMASNQQEIADDLEALRREPPQPADEQPDMGYMTDRRAQFLRNDFLRRMAVRHEDQLAKAGLGYDHLAAEYDRVGGSHNDKAGTLSLGLLARLRAAREMDNARTAQAVRTQNAMARRLGVPVAGVVFNHDLGNARSPEDRIRTVLSYHAMFPNLGLGNMAQAMYEQDAAARGAEGAARAQAEQMAAASGQQAADRDSQERLAMAQLQAQLQAAGLGHQAQYNQTLATNQGAMQQIQAQGQNQMNLQGLVNAGAAQQAESQARLAQLQMPMSMMQGGFAAVQNAPLEQQIGLANGHFNQMFGDSPLTADPKFRAEQVMSYLGGQAQQVAAEAVRNPASLTQGGHEFLQQWMALYEKATGKRPDEGGGAALAHRLGITPQEATQLIFRLRGVRAGNNFFQSPPPNYNYRY